MFRAEIYIYIYVLNAFQLYLFRAAIYIYNIFYNTNSLYIYLCNVVMSIIVLYIIYISLTIIKYYVLTCFDKNKITGAFRPKVEHCDFAVGALRLGSRGIATGALRQWGIATIIRAVT